jgi:ParB-like chromosome segregation protein Spo0J
MAVATGGASIIAHHAAGRMPLDAAKVKRMEKAIRAGESFDPLVVREDGVLRDGHHRLQAYRNVGTKSIEVVSEDEAKRRKLKWRV